jgi:hypothetical protein
MSGTVILLPIVPRRAFHDPSWREQTNRECAALNDAMYAPPPRTRPIKLIDNDALRDLEQKFNEYEIAMQRMRAALSEGGK